MAASKPTDSSTQIIIKSHENQDQAPLGLDLPHATLRAEKNNIKNELMLFTTNGGNTL